MDINMAEQFEKLKGIVSATKKFYIRFNREYLGPVEPTSIVTFSTKIVTVNLFVLAERVPARYLPFSLDQEHLEAVTVYLNEDFEFHNYDQVAQELMGLSVLVGDPEYRYDGTVAGASEFFKNMDWPFKVLY